MLGWKTLNCTSAGATIGATWMFWFFAMTQQKHAKAEASHLWWNDFPNHLLLDIRWDPTGLICWNIRWPPALTSRASATQKPSRGCHVQIRALRGSQKDLRNTSKNAFHWHVFKKSIGCNHIHFQTNWTVKMHQILKQWVQGEQVSPQVAQLERNQSSN